MDYINFLKGVYVLFFFVIIILISRKTVFKCCQEFTCGLCVPLSEAVGSYAENQRITAVRRVYQRGCVNPMINIEQLWRDYSKYEEVRDATRVPSCLSGQAAFLPSHLTSELLINRESTFTWLRR